MPSLLFVGLACSIYWILAAGLELGLRSKFVVTSKDDSSYDAWTEYYASVRARGVVREWVLAMAVLGGGGDVSAVTVCCAPRCGEQGNPTYTAYYVYNLSNYADVVSSGAKPHYEEKGPYTYQFTRKRCVASAALPCGAAAAVAGCASAVADRVRGCPSSGRRLSSRAGATRCSLRSTRRTTLCGTSLPVTP